MCRNLSYDDVFQTKVDKTNKTPFNTGRLPLFELYNI